MSWADVISNKHNAQTSHYVNNKIGPLLCIFHRENLEFFIDECERFKTNIEADKKDKAQKAGIKAVEMVHDLLISHKPEEWKKGVLTNWENTVSIKKGLDSLGFRVLRNYPMINQTHEIIDKHLAGLSEFEDGSISDE